MRPQEAMDTLQRSEPLHISLVGDDAAQMVIDTAYRQAETIVAEARETAARIMAEARRHMAAMMGQMPDAAPVTPGGFASLWAEAGGEANKAEEFFQGLEHPEGEKIFSRS